MSEHEHVHPGFDVEVERTGPCAATVRFSVAAEEWERVRRQGLRNLAQRTRMRGFRPGKTPPAVLEKHFGPQVDREVVQHFLNHAYQDALEKNDLKPAAHPRIDFDAIRPIAGAPLAHEFRVLLRPDVELGQYKGLSIAPEPLDVTDEEVRGSVAELRQQRSRIERAEDGLPEDGMAVCKVEYLRDGREEPLVSREGLRLGPRTTLKGLDPEAYERALTGSRPGDVHELELVIPDDFPDEEARGGNGLCRITVNEAYRIVPPADEELWALLDVEDAERFDAAVRERIREAKERNERLRIEDALMERVIEAHPLDVPPELVEDQAESRVRELRAALEGQELDPAELEARLEAERTRAREASKRALRAIYLMEEIAKQEDLLVRREDLVAEFRSIAERNGVALDEVRKYYQEEGLFQQLALELLERKVRSFLRESADIGGAGAAR
jgi:trigger factor